MTTDPPATATPASPTRTTRRPNAMALGAVAVLLTVVGCSAAASKASSAASKTMEPSKVTQWSADCVKSQTLTGKSQDVGPLSPPDRKPVCTTVTTTSDAVVSNVDFGDISLPSTGTTQPTDASKTETDNTEADKTEPDKTETGKTEHDFRTPVRGVLVTPAKRGASPASLVVMSPLRVSGCIKDAMAYPCPDGKERRVDQGMTYFGEQLAAKGYAVLIPDVSPLYIAQELTTPYDQYAGHQQLVGTMLQKLREANAGTTAYYGVDLANRVDTSQAGLLVHSRSGYTAGPSINALAQSPTKITSVMGYGAALNAPGAEGDFTPDMPDVPALFVQGSEDSDTRRSATRWASEYLAAPRTTPLLAAVVPGLGHNYINRALSEAKIDEREGCRDGAKCPDAAAHEKFLVSTATAWFDATLRGDSEARKQFPLTQTDGLPAKLGGLEAQWLVRPPGARTVAYEPNKVGAIKTVGQAAAAPLICRTYALEDPRVHPDSCPTKDSVGTLETPSNAALFDAGPGAGVTVETAPATAKGIDLALAPTEDRKDKGKGSPLQVTVRAGSEQQVFTLPATDPALRNRATADVNGVYVVGTVRLVLAEAMTKQSITSLEITGADGVTSKIALRQVTLLQA